MSVRQGFGSVGPMLFLGLLLSVGARAGEVAQVPDPRLLEVEAAIPSPSEQHVAPDRGTGSFALGSGPEAVAPDGGPEAVAPDSGPEAVAPDSDPAEVVPLDRRIESMRQKLAAMPPNLPLNGLAAFGMAATGTSVLGLALGTVFSFLGVLAFAGGSSSSDATAYLLTGGIMYGVSSFLLPVGVVSWIVGGVSGLQRERRHQAARRDLLEAIHREEALAADGSY